MDETSLSVAMLHDHVFRPEKSKDHYGTNSKLESQKWTEIHGKARSKQKLIMEVC